MFGPQGSFCLSLYVLSFIVKLVQNALLHEMSSFIEMREKNTCFSVESINLYKTGVWRFSKFSSVPIFPVMCFNMVFCI